MRINQETPIFLYAKLNHKKIGVYIQGVFNDQGYQSKCILK